MLEKEFAQSAYQSALTSLELARADASRQHRYLARIAEPSIPDEATFPRRGLGILTVFVLSVVFMSIASLVTAAVREHARI
jgi:capsular polysaccharide transport system permease protein